MTNSKTLDARLPSAERTGLYVILRPDLTIVDASNAYLRATMTWRETLRGVHMLEAFPDNPDDRDADGVHKLSTSLRKVIEERAPDVMDVQRYDVQDRVSPDGPWVEKYWKVVNYPVYSDQRRKLVRVVHRVVDVTDLVLTERRIAELLQVNHEQERSLKDLLAQLLERHRNLVTARTKLTHSFRCAWQLPDRDLDLPSGVRAVQAHVYLHAGERVPVTGLYRPFHMPGCEALRDPKLFVEGEPLPPCRRCPDVRYLLRDGYNLRKDASR